MGSEIFSVRLQVMVVVVVLVVVDGSFLFHPSTWKSIGGQKRVDVVYVVTMACLRTKDSNENLSSSSSISSSFRSPSFVAVVAVAALRTTQPSIKEACTEPHNRSITQVDTTLDGLHNIQSTRCSLPVF